MILDNYRNSSKLNYIIQNLILVTLSLLVYSNVQSVFFKPIHLFIMTQ